MKRIHLKICKDIERKFGIKQVIKDGIPSHLTLKYTFTTNKIIEVENLIASFCKHNNKTSFRIKGYGTFGKKAIFINVIPSKTMLLTFKRFVDELKKLPWMRWHGVEENMHFHLSVAHTDMKEKDFAKVMRYLKKYKINQKIFWDNIAIIRKKNHRWTVYKKYKFKK